VKTAFIALTVGFVTIAVVAICVLALVTSTTRGTEWLLGGRRTGDTERPPESPGD